MGRVRLRDWTVTDSRGRLDSDVTGQRLDSDVSKLEIKKTLVHPLDNSGRAATGAGLKSRAGLTPGLKFCRPDSNSGQFLGAIPAIRAT